MTEPTGESPTTPTPDAAALAPPAAAPPPTAPPTTLPPMPAPQAVPVPQPVPASYQQPAPDAFAAVPRPPRQPWVNPARRLHVVAAAVIGALVFAGGGIAIGNAISDGHNGRVGPLRIERNFLPPNGRGQLVRPGGRYGNGPGNGPGNGVQPAAPNASPSPGKTS